VNVLRTTLTQVAGDMLRVTRHQEGYENPGVDVAGVRNWARQLFEALKADSAADVLLCENCVRDAGRVRPAICVSGRCDRCRRRALVYDTEEQIMPHVHIEPDAQGAFNLSLNSVRVITGESHQVVSNVAGFLVHPETLDDSECADVARRIMGHTDDDGELERDRILEEQERQDFAQDEWEPGAADMLGADEFEPPEEPA
jgi:hypothetical protein